MAGVEGANGAGGDASSSVSMTDLDPEKSCFGVKDDLLDALSTIEKSNPFAGFDVMGNLGNIGLQVHGVGPIDTSIGLKESTAKRLIAKARQAPCGKSSKTMIDTSSKSAWELDADQFSFSGTRWKGIMDILSPGIGIQFGIDGPIRAEVYKMLIYEEGASCKPHTEYDKPLHYSLTFSRLFSNN